MAVTSALYPIGMLGTVISAVWLAIRREWATLGWGLLFLFGAFVLLDEAVWLYAFLSKKSAAFASRGKLGIAMLLSALAGLYMSSLVGW